MALPNPQRFNTADQAIGFAIATRVSDGNNYDVERVGGGGFTLDAMRPLLVAAGYRPYHRLAMNLRVQRPANFAEAWVRPNRPHPRALDILRDFVRRPLQPPKEHLASVHARVNMPIAEFLQTRLLTFDLQEAQGHVYCTAFGGCGFGGRLAQLSSPSRLPSRSELPHHYPDHVTRSFRNGEIVKRSRVVEALVTTSVLCGVSACGPAPSERMNSANDASSAITAVLQSSADAWNNSDLAGHVRPYAESATFMGSNGPILGRDRVSDALARSFWQAGKPKQQLSFDRITIRELGDGHALTTGHFLLTGGGEADRSGWFSLTWEKTAAGWQIIHDHSS